MQKSKDKRKLRPAAHQKRQPGMEFKMDPKPEFDDHKNSGSGKLRGRVALITGGDSGIGRAVAVSFAKEGCDVGIIYYNEHKDAAYTKRAVEAIGHRCLLIPGDISDDKFCKKAVGKIYNEYKNLNIVVNNAAVQFPQKDIMNITKRQLYRTFETNIFSFFYVTQASLKFLKPGSSIINTTSVTAYRGSEGLIDYSSTKGAIVSFTRSLSHSLIEKKIRVNAVAPGPVWTPLIPASFPAKKVATFGSEVPMARAAEPEEIAPCYVFLACDDSSYITGQVLHPNGGEIING